MHCKIYFREKNGDNWGPVDSLSNVINSDTYTTTQPSVGIDEKSGKEILFFVTDRLVDTTDNIRDLNIWCSYRGEKGEWEEPGYIDSINTDGEDVTPFFYTPTQTLYFSSNGWRNLGGFDIYSIQKNGMEWGTIDGMGLPLNSSYDEMYYTINAEGSAAYMSSNRPGGSCDPQDSLCVCNDIYKAPQICLKVRTFNELTRLPLFGTEVVLDEANMNSPKKQSKLDSHIYDFFVGFDRSYSVDGTKIDRWIPDRKEFNTIDAKGGACDTVDLYLKPLVDVDVFTFDKTTGEPLPGCKVEISLVDDIKGRADSADVIQYNFGLNFGKRYKIVATKKGYNTDTSFKTVTDNIAFEPKTLRDELYLCKLPTIDTIRLYFANDEPGPHTRKDTISTSNYSETYDSYLKIKPDFYKNNAYGDRAKVDAFFNTIISEGEKLDTFTSNLFTYLKLLNEGQTLTVVVKGFASPLGPKDKGSYNYALSKRRIDSIRKYFKENLSPDEYAKLKVKSVPNGDRTSPPTVPKTGKAAEFGIDSSKERRVEIIAIRLSPGACLDLTNIPTEPIPTKSY